MRALQATARYRYQPALIKIVSTHLNRLKRILLIAVAGYYNDFGMWGKLQDFPQRGEAFIDALWVWRQAQVLKNHQRLMPAQLVDRRSPILRRQDFIVFEAPAELTHQPRVVFDNQ